MADETKRPEKVVMLIGSTSYMNKMEEYKKRLEAEGCEVMMPVFDSAPELNELGICAANMDMIMYADEVHLLWDGRSIGTVFDLGMCFALGKPLTIAYLNHKTMEGLVRQYAKISDFIKESYESGKTPSETELAKFGTKTND